MIFWFFLLLASFFFYHFTFFSYTSYIFSHNKVPKIKGAICGVINFVFWYYYITNFDINAEATIMVCYFILLALQTKIVFKANFLHTIFIAVTFSINLFAKRIMFFGFFPLINGEQPIEFFSMYETRMFVSIITFALSVSTISFARKMLARIYLDTILADKNNIRFLSFVFTILFVAFVAFFFTFSTEGGGTNLLMHYMISGTFGLSAFAIFIIFAYYLADFRISTATYKKIIQNNDREKNIVKILEEQSQIDNFTGLFNRAYANEKIEECLRQQSAFYVAFVDLDGLKIVNDKYGHDEGDFYIKTVCDIVSEYFSDDITSRYGGDEIVILGEYDSEDSVMLNLVKCYNAVSKIPEIYGKEYSTSISYGVAFKSPNEVISSEELLKVADSRMYELKKLNNKIRKTLPN